MEIPGDILEDLKCGQCKLYLSCGPVQTRTDGVTLCGRCAPGGAATRSVPYERLASLFKFPCRYAADGCTEQLQMHHVQPHENQCRYKQFLCSSLTGSFCPWSGTLHTVEDHIEQQHPQKLVSHPYTDKPDIDQDSEMRFVIQEFDLLFLVRSRFRVAAATLEHCVSLLEIPYGTQMFYTIQFTSKSVKNSKTRAVIEYTPEQDDYTMVTDLKSLQYELGSFDSVEMALSLRARCSVCAKDITDDATSHRYRGCKDYKHCKYQWKGCTYVGDVNNRVKHEECLCEYSSWRCYVCECDVVNESVMDHGKRVHGPVINSNTFTRDDVAAGDTLHIAMLKWRGVVFRCLWRIDTNSRTYIEVASDLPWSEAVEQYSCEVDYTDPDEEDECTPYLRPDLEDTSRDWFYTVTPYVARIRTYNIQIKLVEYQNANPIILMNTWHHSLL